MGNSLEGRDTLMASRITGVCRYVLQGHTGGVFTLAFAAHDQQLISGNFDRTIRVWNLQTGESVKVLRGHTGGIWSVAVCLDNQLLGLRQKTPIK